MLTESDSGVFYKPLGQLGDPTIIPKIIDKICAIRKFGKKEITNNILINFENYLTSYSD